MSLLDQTSPANQVPAAERRARRIKQHIAASWRQIVSAHQQGMSLMWDGGDEAPAADVIAALGTDAAEAFALSGQLADLVAANDATQVRGLPDGVTYTANQDGSVTLS